MGAPVCGLWVTVDDGRECFNIDGTALTLHADRGERVRVAVALGRTRPAHRLLEPAGRTRQSNAPFVFRTRHSTGLSNHTIAVGIGSLSRRPVYYL